MPITTDTIPLAEVEQITRMLRRLLAEMARQDAGRGSARMNAIRLLGERLHELGAEFEEMLIAAKLTARGRTFFERMDIIDEAWRGVGKEAHDHDD